ncbi:MAG: hypothetical protein U9N83_03575 [Thermodesulfobacteriota bacterium]|nr:hypothetical protein [Thermodesulfobacteriota bacterium]
MKKHQESIKQERKMIFEMIDASWELAERLGDHPVTTGCNCISCVNKRKRILKKHEKEWKFSL